MFNAWEIWDATKDFSFWSIALAEIIKSTQISNFPDTSDKTDYLIGDFSDHIICTISLTPSFGLFNKQNNKTSVPNKIKNNKKTHMQLSKCVFLYHSILSNKPPIAQALRVTSSEVGRNHPIGETGVVELLRLLMDA